MWPIVQGVILVAGALFFMVIADKFNRRTLIRFGGIVMALSFILPSVINALIPNANPMMIVVFLCIYVAFYVGLLFPIMTASMSDSAVFAIFGVICILGVFFVHFFVPETKGRTLEEIEEKSLKKAS